MVWELGLAEKVEGFVDELGLRGLVENDFTHLAQLREVHHTGRIFLVVEHDFSERIVVIAGDRRATIMLRHIARDGVEVIRRETKARGGVKSSHTNPQATA